MPRFIILKQFGLNKSGIIGKKFFNEPPVDFSLFSNNPRQ